MSLPIAAPKRRLLRRQTSRVVVDWRNPLTNKLLLFATPYSNFSTPPIAKSVTRYGTAIRRGILARPAVTHGVANSTILIQDVCVGTDGGNWWNAQDIVYSDTSTGYPNDFGIIIRSAKLYGNVQLTARNTSETNILVDIDVFQGNLASASQIALTRVVTIDSSLLVRAWGNGVYFGSSTALQGNTFNAPAANSASPAFGCAGVDDPVTMQTIVLRWGRVLSDAEIQSISANPWQIFKPRSQFVYISLPNAYFPSQDVTTTGWSRFPTDRTYAQCINEFVADDDDLITSPGIDGSQGPYVSTLTRALSPGSYTVNLRGRYTLSAAFVRATLLAEDDTPVGTTGWQAVTASLTTHQFSVTCSGTATKLMLEVQ